MVVAVNPTEFEYLEGNIPSEWDAWIRGRRKQPPSIEELVKNQHYREHIKGKAREVEERELALQAKEYEEGLVARPTQTIAKGHAAATSFGQPETSEEPTIPVYPLMIVPSNEPPRSIQFPQRYKASYTGQE
ncbi:unnamed protein product [Coregonus sp. 'balchen']|nr:unnamed protein product [Coregonus sp. 'balchen']